MPHVERCKKSFPQDMLVSSCPVATFSAAEATFSVPIPKEACCLSGSRYASSQISKTTRPNTPVAMNIPCQPKLNIKIVSNGGPRIEATDTPLRKMEEAKPLCVGEKRLPRIFTPEGMSVDSAI